MTQHTYQLRHFEHGSVIDIMAIGADPEAEHPIRIPVHAGEESHAIRTALDLLSHLNQHQPTEH